MAQEEEEIAAKFNYRNLEKETLLPHIVPWPPNARHGALMHTNTYIHISKINEEVLFKNVRQILKKI